MPDYRVKRSKTTENLPEIIELLANAVAGANLATRRRIRASATPGQRLLCGYFFYEDYVNNGGHWQYFRNYTSNLWEEALQATRVLRLPEEKILRDAVALFPDQRPAQIQREPRQQLAQIKQTDLDRLDERFYGRPGGDKKIRQYYRRASPGIFSSEKDKVTVVATPWRELGRRTYIPRHQAALVRRVRAWPHRQAWRACVRKPRRS